MPKFEKGKPPGPGRPPGLRNKTSQLLDTIAGEGTERVIRTVQEKAEKGELYAAAPCWRAPGHAVAAVRYSSICRPSP